MYTCSVYETGVNRLDLDWIIDPDWNNKRMSDCYLRGTCPSLAHSIPLLLIPLTHMARRLVRTSVSCISPRKECTIKEKNQGRHRGREHQNQHTANQFKSTSASLRPNHVPRIANSIDPNHMPSYHQTQSPPRSNMSGTGTSNSHLHAYACACTSACAFPGLTRHVF